MPSMVGAPPAGPFGNFVTEETVTQGYASVTNAAGYGVTGDGVADDTAELQAALDGGARRGWHMVWIPAGTFLISSPLLVPSKTSIVGAGMGVTTIKVKAGSYTGTAKMSVLLNENYADYATDDVMVDSDIHVRDLTVDGNRANMTSVATEQEGIDWVGVENFTIVRCEIINVVHDGIDLDACHYGLIADCVMDNCGWNGVHAGWSAQSGNWQVTVKDCLVTDCGEDRNTFNDGFNAGIHNDSTSGIVSGCTVTGCWQGILVSSSSGGGAVVSNNYVGTTMSDYGISFASTYGRLVSNYVVPSATATAPIILSGAFYMTCSGNTVSHGTYGIRVQASKPATVSGNAVRGSCIQYAIEVDNAAHIITGNTIENYPSNAARGAIHVISDATGSVISGNRVDASSGTGRGVYSAAAGVTISGNSFNGTPAAYIEVAAADNVVTGNNGRAAATAGLVLSAASSYAMVSGNVFRGSAAGGTDAGSSNVFGTNSPTIP